MRTNRTTVLGAALLALVVSACGPGEGGTSPSAPPASQDAALPSITVGSAGFWESAVVAEIYAQALEDAGFTVARKLELGARDLTHPALLSGDLDIMPEYVGGYLAVTFDGTPSPDLDASVADLRAALEAVDLVALDPTPGTDADGFAVRSETADEWDLATLSDLAAVAGDLRWGVAPECAENPNCGVGLEEIYGIDFASLDVQTLGACSPAIAEALNANSIDVAQVCTTQPEIIAYNLVLLADDLGMAPAQNIVPIVRQELMDEAGDLIASTLNAVSELLTTEELATLGNTVVIGGTSYADAASQWLSDNGL